jgi:serine/threonine-protein kinase
VSLTPGTRLGDYEILSALGAGGMGEVYRAKDATLGRDVAIKVLPVSVADDAERLARFEREAKLLASLSHANIAQVYGLGQSDGAGAAPGDHRPRRFLVMELAPGDDLTLRLGRGPIPLDEALPMAIQAALALEAAHERGIVHRDLKPANIKVSAEGAVKVLDFGLAKALGPDAANGSSDAMNSPTLTAAAFAAGYGGPGTEMGVILGTAAYMSPEQARGREADKRADIWAFGVVFFEMLSGARLFQGETISDTLAAVLRQDVPWTRLPAATPKEIVRLLRRCLERDRKNRLHDIADARIVLEEVARGGAADDPAPAVPVSNGRSRWLLVAAVAAAMFALGLIGGRYTAPSAPAAAGTGMVRLVVPMPSGVIDATEPAVAPDGSFVVFVGRTRTRGQQLYRQRLDQSAPEAIPRTDGAAQPFVSANGRWIAFRKNNHLMKIAVDGGEPLDITAIAQSGPGAVWLADETILFGPSWLSALTAVSPDGGTTRSVSTLDTARGEIGHWYPNALPGGRHVLMTVWVKGAGVNDAEIAVLDLQTGRHTILLKGAEGRYLAPGFITFFRAGAYHAVRFEPATLTASGDPVRILDDAYGNTPEGDVLQAGLSAGGTFAYVSGPAIPTRELTWMSAGGQMDALPFSPRAYNGADVTRAGTRAAVAAQEAGRYVLRILDLNRGTDDALDLPGSNWSPTWHPDGDRLAFQSMRKGDFDVYWKDVTTSAAAEPLLVTDLDELPEAFLPDGQSLIVYQSGTDGQYLPKLMPLSPPGEPVTLVPFNAARATISRDGALMAFRSPRTGTMEIYVQPIVPGAVAERVSTAGGIAVAWSRDRDELYYLRPPEIVAVPYRLDGGRFRGGTERVWSRVDGDYSEAVFSIGPEGRLLVAYAKDRVPREIRVIVNWQQEIAGKLGK